MWGAILRGLPLLVDLGKGAINFAKNHKTMSTILGVPTVGAGVLALSGKDNSQEQATTQTQEQATNQEQKQSPKQGQKQTAKKSGNGKTTTANTSKLPPLNEILGTGSNVSGDLPSPTSEADGQEGGSTLSKIASQIYTLFGELDKHRQVYDNLSQQYLQANDIYEKQLLQTMQTIPFLLAKTPLNNITTEDLNEHLTNLLTSMPYTEAVEKVNNVVKGYYLAKTNGVDPKSLSTTDLTMIAENPVLARSVNENIVQFLEQTGEILKYKIKSNMDKVGALKDQYQNVLKELEEKGKLYKSIIDAIKFEMKQDYDLYKFNTKLNTDMQKFSQKLAYDYANLNERKEYHNKQTALREKSLEAKQEKSNAPFSKMKPEE
jgi:hypothetical protein